MRAPTLTDGVVTLRAHREDDVRQVLEQCQDPDMQRWTTVPVPYVLDDAKTFVRHLVPGGWEADRSWDFAVTARVDDDELFVGSMGLTNRGGGAAFLGFGTHPAARRRGFTERAARLLLQWGFAERDLQVVDWFAYRGNWPSRRLAWRLGFDVVPGRHWSEQRGTQVEAWYGSLAAGEPMAPRHPWYDVPVLRGERVTLRPMTDGDLPGITETQSDERTRWFSEGPRTREPHLGPGGLPFVQGCLELAARGEMVPWTVVDATDGRFVGVVLLPVQHRRRADLGFMTHPSARGRGLTREAVELALRHAFVAWDDGGLGLDRVTAWAASTNEASRRLLRSVGMTEGGRVRTAVLLGDGTWDDDVVHDLPADEWVSRRRC